MYVNPGELNKNIKIVCDSGTVNENGFPTGEMTIHKCYAKYTRKTGTEKDEAGAEVNEAPVRFLIRYTKKEINKNMTVLYKNRRYDIQDVNDIGEQHRYLELFCKEGDL